MNNVCEWYDYESQTCNRDDKYCELSLINDKREYGVYTDCKKIDMESKTIEERAWDNNSGSLPNDFDYRNGYVDGASEQKDIDIKRACQCLCDVCGVGMGFLSTYEKCKTNPCKSYLEFKKKMEK